MSTIYLNDKELEIIDDALGHLGDGYWEDDDELWERLQNLIKKIYSKRKNK